MSKFKVYISDVNRAREYDVEPLKAVGGELFDATGTDPETLIREGKDCDAIINVFSKITSEVIEGLNNCKVIVRTGIGVDTIDIEAASKKGIMVANVPDYCWDEVADHTFALFLSLTRKVCLLSSKVKSGVWNNKEAGWVPRLQGLVFGLYGFGNIARKVAQRAKAFGMDVQAYDPYAPAGLFEEMGVKRLESLDGLFKTADFLSLHVPLVKETKHIINLDNLKKMKSTAYVINTARGPLINEEDLLYALNNKIIAGAALDVLETEPPKFPFALNELDNVIITPHASFYSNESFPQLRKNALEEVIRTLTEGRPKNLVNKDAFQ